MSDADLRSRKKWKKKAYTCVSANVYRTDADDFRRWCADNGTTINAFLRACISAALNRPLENRASYQDDVDRSAAVTAAANAALEQLIG